MGTYDEMDASEIGDPAPEKCAPIEPARCHKYEQEANLFVLVPAHLFALDAAGTCQEVA